ncbi:MAG: alanine racemase [bacterium]
MPKPLSYIELSKHNLLSNIKQFGSILPKGQKLVAVVKANAYGHGLKEVVSISHAYIDYFQVDDIAELTEIRKYTNKPVLVFGYVALDQLDLIFKHNAVLGVYNTETVETLNRLALKNKQNIKIHLKMDAFLGRQGIMKEDLEKYISLIKKTKYIQLESIYTHFSNIEDVDNLNHADKQFEELLKAKEIVKSLGFPNISHHVSATSGFLTDQDKNWESSLLRLGIGMYGLWPSASLKNKLSKKIVLKPVMRWITKLAQIKSIPKGFPIGYGLTFVTKRKTKIGIVPQGYSDGYDRGFSNNSTVLVRGKRCPVLGRVAMNIFVVDLTNVKGVHLEDEVVLLGNQEKATISADELANKINTINYEIVARVSSLLDRVVV